MLKNPVYKQFAQIIFNGNYTVEQVENMTYWDVLALLPADKFTVTLFKKMKRLVIETLQNETDNNRASNFSATLARLLDKDSVREHGREGSKPFVTIWPEGKPDVNSV